MIDLSALLRRTCLLFVAFLTASISHAQSGNSVEGVRSSNDWITFSDLLANPLLTTFLAIALGLFIGQVTIKGVSLGMAGIFVAGLVLGRIGYRADAGFEQLGVAFLLYGIGLGAGPTFFRALGRYGRQALAVVVPMVIAGALTTILFVKFAGVPLALAIGSFAGSMKSSSAFASAVNRFPDEMAHVAVGFGVGYPISLVAIVLVVQVVPKLVRQDLSALSACLDAGRPPGRSIGRELVEISNGTVLGSRLSRLEAVERLDCRVQFVLEGDRLTPLGPENVAREGMVVLVVGPTESLAEVAQLLGHKSNRFVLEDPDFEQADIMVTSPDVAGKSLGELNPPINYGVIVREVNRMAAKLVPQEDLVLHARDVLRVDGPATGVRAFAHAAGHHPKALQQTDMLSLAVGLALGLVLGSLTITLPGAWQFNLGMAGGPLVVALLLGHFGHLAGVAGRFPPATQLFLIRLGLSLLLAGAAVRAGAEIETVFSQFGFVLLAMTLAIMIVAVVVGLVTGRLFCGDLLQSLASLAGGMNATPAYERLSSRADSDLVLVIFTTAYVFAMLMMVLTTEILIAMLRTT